MKNPVEVKVSSVLNRILTVEPGRTTVSIPKGKYIYLNKPAGEKWQENLADDL